MSLMVQRVEPGDLSAPRVSGDEPGSVTPKAMDAECSPRERG